MNLCPFDGNIKPCNWVHTHTHDQLYNILYIYTYTDTCIRLSVYVHSNSPQALRETDVIEEPKNDYPAELKGYS